MLLNIKTTAERETDGLCPKCFEHTTAGESCCGYGAVVEGSLVSDELIEEEKLDPYTCIRLLTAVSHVKAAALHSALYQSGVSSNLFSESIQDDTWNVNVFVAVNQLKID